MRDFRIIKDKHIIGNKIIFYNGYYHLIKYQIGNAYYCDSRVLGPHIFMSDKVYNCTFK